MSKVYLFQDLIEFAEQEVDVKSYQRLSKGKLVTVQKYNRNQDKADTPQGAKKAESSLQNVALTTATIAGAFAAVAGGSLLLVAAKHNNVVKSTAERAIATTQQVDKNYVMLSNRTQVLAKDIDMTGKDGFILAMGGFSREHGDHSFQLAKHLELEFPTKKVIVVDNKAFDIVWEGDRNDFNINRFIKKSVALSADAHVNGNDTVLEAARTLKMLNMSHPQFDKKIVTASGGGALATQILEVNDKMGEKSIEALALGSPRFGFTAPKRSKLTVITDPNDQMMGKSPFANPGANVTLLRPDRGTESFDNWGEQIPINKAHQFSSYTGSKVTRPMINDFMNRRSA
jgi:hypothetical protein